MHFTKKILLAVLPLCLLAFGASRAGAATLTVDDNLQCPGASFATIQSAVNAAGNNDKINVCPGTYNEQVKITKSLSIQGIEFGGQNLALIKPVGVLANSTSLSSGNPIAAIVLVDGASKVDLTNLTVDGSTNGIGGCLPDLMGVYYRNSSGKMDSLAIRNVRLGAGLGGCDSGEAIFVQSGSGGSSKVDVNNSSVHDFQKNGISGNEAGTDISIKGNAVSGDGPTTAIAQNGVQIAFGAKGTVDGNSVNNIVFIPCTQSDCSAGSATGILLYFAAPTKVMNNNIGNTQTGVFLFGDKGEANHNTIFQTRTFDGVAIVGDDNKANENTIFNSDESGVFVLGNKNDVKANTINETPVGVLEGSPSSGNKYEGNKFYNTTNNSNPPGLVHASVTASARIASPANP